MTAHIAEATVRVDCAISQGPIRRIWTSFGYDEINWTCTPAGKRALKVIGQFAEQPYYVRSHYIFNSGIGWSLPHWGAGNVYHEDAAGRPFYDFTIADQVYDAVVEAGLRPLVELAFTPRALVPDDAEQRFRYEPSPTQWSPYTRTRATASESGRLCHGDGPRGGRPLPERANVVYALLRREIVGDIEKLMREVEDFLRKQREGGTQG